MSTSLSRLVLAACPGMKGMEEKKRESLLFHLNLCNVRVPLLSLLYKRISLRVKHQNRVSKVYPYQEKALDADTIILISDKFVPLICSSCEFSLLTKTCLRYMVNCNKFTRCSKYIHTCSAVFIVLKI